MPRTAPKLERIADDHDAATDRLTDLIARARRAFDGGAITRAEAADIIGGLEGLLVLLRTLAGDQSIVAGVVAAARAMLYTMEFTPHVEDLIDEVRADQRRIEAQRVLGAIGLVRVPA